MKNDERCYPIEFDETNSDMNDFSLLYNDIDNNIDIVLFNLNEDENIK